MKKYLLNYGLCEDFFRMGSIRKLRSLPGGDTFTVIALEIYSIACETDNIISFCGSEDEFVEKVANLFEERPDFVKFTLDFLIKHLLITELE